VVIGIEFQSTRYSLNQNSPEPKARASLKMMLKSLKIGWSEKQRL